jgi:hypothetical protein
MNERPNETRLIVRAVDLVIADVQKREPSYDRDEELTVLHRLRAALLDGDSTAD